MAIISAAPTSKLTSDVAEKAVRLKSESSITGQFLRRSVSVSRAIKAASNTSAAAINQRLFCMGAVPGAPGPGAGLS